MKNQNKPVKFGLAISLLALLAACAAPSLTTLSDGTVAYRIDCDATAQGLNYCFERAGKTCGAAGYRVVGRDGRIIATSDVADSDRVAQVSAFDTGQNKDSILISCGN